jgi:UDP-N-acetylmuramyl pentapeptide phosphotransferase/UDP-N-acetylglucosamine-1-phosphate transferase
MLTILEGTADLAYIFGFTILSAIIAFLWAPLLSKVLYKFHVIKGVKTELKTIDAHLYKSSTPVMGGLLVIITVAVLTFIFNWYRSFTWVPIGVMLFSGALGATDDKLDEVAL